jgi:ABC-type uncharacterized transport system permease subunit
MSTISLDDLAILEPVRFWTRARKVGVGIAVAGVLAGILFAAGAGSQPARFTFTERPDGPSIGIDGRTGAIVFAALAVLAGLGMLAPAAERWFRVLLGMGIVTIVLSFLCWQISSAPAGLNFMPLVDIVRGTFLGALPLIFGALAGVLCERSGVVNVAIEGQLLAGAFGAALLGSIAGNAWLGILGGIIGGVLISALLAWFAIRYLVDQVVLGIVINLLAVGLTGFVYEQVMRPDPARYNQPPRVPVLGPAIFTGNIFLFLGLILVVVINVALFRTRWGLRTRSVGEHPAAADTLGIKVLRVRFGNVLLAGVVAGIGGAYFTLGLVSQFNKNMISGKGFIALAALIFGRWSPTGALLAALFFGFADKLAGFLGGISSPIPSAFLNMLPYLATILAVAGLVGRVRAPAADGVPYVKG